MRKTKGLHFALNSIQDPGKMFEAVDKANSKSSNNPALLINRIQHLIHLECDRGSLG